MKKIYTLLMAVAVIFMAASCSDDSEGYSGLNKLEIIKSNLTFDNTASTGTIEVKANGPLTAKSSEEWCTTTVNGNVVTVSVPELKTRDARSAIISLSDGIASVDVPVYQYASIFGISGESKYILGKNGDEYSLKGKINIPYDIIASDDWITYEKTDDGYTVKVAPNEGTARKGTITFKSELGEKCISFVQIGTDEFAGTYTAKYYDPYVGWEEKTGVVFNADGNNCVIEKLSKGENVVIPFTYDPETLSFIQNNRLLLGQYLENGTNYYLKMVTIANTPSGGVSSSTSLNYKIGLGYDWDDEADKLVIKVINTGTWAGYTQMGFGIGKYSSETSISNKGYLNLFYYLKFIKE